MSLSPHERSHHVEAADEAVRLRVIGKPKRTLAQRLKAFEGIERTAVQREQLFFQ